MKTITIAIAATALIAGSADAARKPSDHGEKTGLGVGGIVGAIAGGPVGFLVGGAAGGFFGNKHQRTREAREELAANYEEARALASTLQAMLADGEQEIEQLHLVMRQQESTHLQQESAYRDALREAFDIEVYFRTGEAALDQSVADRVERLGEILKDFDDFSIVLEGHADPRGEEAYNEQLSADRASAVREALIRSGLPGDKITTRAIGERESRAADGDIDGMALERRVDVGVVYLPRENRVARQ